MTEKDLPTGLSIEEAAEFWDRCDVTDYLSMLESVDFEVSEDLRSRYQFDVDTEQYLRLRKLADRVGMSVQAVVRQLLENGLLQAEKKR